jgi:hypothetical protein
MAILTMIVFPNLENDRIQTLSHPTDSAILFRQVRALVKIIRMSEYFPRFFEADSSLRIQPQSPALSFVEVKPHSVV